MKTIYLAGSDCEDGESQMSMHDTPEEAAKGVEEIRKSLAWQPNTIFFSGPVQIAEWLDDEGAWDAIMEFLQENGYEKAFQPLPAYNERSVLNTLKGLHDML